MKFYIILFLLFISNFLLYAQKTPKFIIKGIVFEQSGEAIPYEYVRLINSKNNVLLIAGITNDKGTFNLNVNKADTGSYKLTISFVGFSSKTIDLTINENKTIYDLRKITLKQTDIQLNETVVVGERKKMQSYINKDVVIPDSTMINSSMDAIDLLSKVPQLKVDRINKAVTILGRENVLVLINGIEKKGNSDFKSIQPNDIDRIEIITNPSAKYDAEYTGIINIILKKKFKQGLTGDIDLNYYGLRHSEPSISISYGFSKIRIFANYSFYFRNHQQNSLETRISKNNNNNFKYNNEYISENPLEYGHIFQFGTDYFINDKNTLNITGNFMYIKENKRALSKTTTYQNDSLTENFESNIYRKGNYSMQNYSIYYKKDFHNPENKFTTDINFYKMNFVSNVFYTDYYLLPSFPDNLISRKIITNDDKYSINLKTDYIQIIVKKISLETGYNFYVWNYKNSTNENYKTDKFVYNENRNAVYFNVLWKLKIFQFITGVRTENTNLLINDSINNKYLHFIPLFGIKYNINENQIYRFNYKRNLSRPKFNSLNPYFYQQDSLNFRVGNPYLKPAEYDFFEFNYSYNNDGFYFSPSIYFRKGKYIFGSQITQIGNIRYVKNENIAKSQKLGLQINSSITFFKFIKINPFLEINYTKIIDNTINNDGYSFSFSLSTELTLPKNSFMGIDLSLPEKYYYLQGYTKDAFTVNDIYISKSVFKKSGIVSVGITNPFNNIITYTYENFNNIETNTKDIIDFRMFFIRFIYSFSRGKEFDSLERQYNMERDK